MWVKFCLFLWWAATKSFHPSTCDFIFLHVYYLELSQLFWWGLYAAFLLSLWHHPFWNFCDYFPVILAAASILVLWLLKPGKLRSFFFFFLYNFLLIQLGCVNYTNTILTQSHSLSFFFQHYQVVIFQECATVVG